MTVLSTSDAPTIILHTSEDTNALWQSQAAKVEGHVFIAPTNYSNITGDLNITKYCTSCDYSASVFPPYGSATITLRISHNDAFAKGLLSVYDNTYQKPIMKPGRWVTISSPSSQGFVNSLGDLLNYSSPDAAILFYGRVSSVQQDLSIGIDDAVPFSQFVITVDHFFSPFMSSQTRRTPLRIEKIKEIHPAAIGESEVKNNVILEGLNRFADTRSDEHIEDALQYFLDSLGHFAFVSTEGVNDTDIKVVTQTGPDRIQGRPAPSYYTSAFRQRTATMWGLLQSIFYPNQELLELFPRLDHNATSVSSAMKMVYRYKPLNPSIDTPQNSYMFEFFGPDKTSREHLKIESAQVSSISLSWNESSRTNAINLSIPFEIGEGGDSLLFGVGCVPVFDQVDINTYGLRAYTANTPFIAQGSQPDAIAKYNQIAPSALAERLYLLLGEGEKYATGTITCIYDAKLISYIGSWATLTMPDYKDLTFYILGVRNSFAVDPFSGAPIARSFIEIERASYVFMAKPKFTPKQVRLQRTVPRKQNTKKRRPSRTKNRGS